MPSIVINTLSNQAPVDMVKKITKIVEKEYEEKRRRMGEGGEDEEEMDMMKCSHSYIDMKSVEREYEEKRSGDGDGDSKTNGGNGNYEVLNEIILPSDFSQFIENVLEDVITLGNSHEEMMGRDGGRRMERSCSEASTLSLSSSSDSENFHPFGFQSSLPHNDDWGDGFDNNGGMRRNRRGGKKKKKKKKKKGKKGTRDGDDGDDGNDHSSSSPHHLLSSGQNLSSSGWRLNFNKKKVLVWSSSVSHSPWRILSASTTLPCQSIEEMLDILLEEVDIFDPLMISRTVLYRIDDSSVIQHVQYKGTWPSQPRDFIILTTWRVLGEGYVIASRSLSPPYDHQFDVRVKSGGDDMESTRGYLMLSGYIITPHHHNPNHHYMHDTDDPELSHPLTTTPSSHSLSPPSLSSPPSSSLCRVDVSLFLHVDPKGYIPAWLLNLLSTQGPVDLLSNLRSLLTIKREEEEDGGDEERGERERGRSFDVLSAASELEMAIESIQRGERELISYFGEEGVGSSSSSSSSSLSQSSSRSNNNMTSTTSSSSQSSGKKRWFRKGRERGSSLTLSPTSQSSSVMNLTYPSTLHIFPHLIPLSPQSDTYAFFISRLLALSEYSIPPFDTSSISSSLPLPPRESNVSDDSDGLKPSEMINLKALAHLVEAVRPCSISHLVRRVKEGVVVERLGICR